MKVASEGLRDAGERENTLRNLENEKQKGNKRKRNGKNLELIEMALPGHIKMVDVCACASQGVDS